MKRCLLLLVAVLGCPDDPVQEGRRLEAEGRFAQAAQAYLDAARADPALLAAWDGAVRTQCRVRTDVAGCLEVLDLELEVLGSVQRHADVLSQSLERRGRARLEQGLLDAAEEDLERARAAGPERASVFAAWARLQWARGDREAARRALDAARRRAPDLAELEGLYRLLEDTTVPEGFGGEPSGSGK